MGVYHVDTEMAFSHFHDLLPVMEKRKVDFVLQGSNLKKFLSRLLATIEEKMVAKCKNAVAR